MDVDKYGIASGVQLDFPVPPTFTESEELADNVVASVQTAACPAMPDPLIAPAEPQLRIQSPPIQSPSLKSPRPATESIWLGVVEPIPT